MLIRRKSIEYVDGDFFALIDRLHKLFPHLRSGRWHLDNDLEWLVDRLNDMDVGCEVMVLEGVGDHAI